MKLGQLIKYNMRNVFLEKSYTKSGGEASRRPFYNKVKLSVSPDQKSKMVQSLFLLHMQVKLYQNMLKLRR